MYKSKGFTLIELLIVVAIIGILAAIAVPNFLNAQVRAKVSRAVADLKTLETAMEIYQLDNNDYPPANMPRVPGTVDAWHPNEVRFYRLTTPISYISSVPRDPFTNFSSADYAQWGWAYDFINGGWGHAWRINSWGPDNINGWGGARTGRCINGQPDFIYQSSNGLNSIGDIVWVGRKVTNDGYCNISNGI